MKPLFDPSIRRKFHFLRRDKISRAGKDGIACDVLSH